MFKTDSFLGNKKLSLNQNVWRDHAMLFHCLPLWKTVLFVSSRAFLLSTPVENSEATQKKAKKCNKTFFYFKLFLFQIVELENSSRDKQVENDRINQQLEKVQTELTVFRDLLENKDDQIVKLTNQIHEIGLFHCISL